MEAHERREGLVLVLGLAAIAAWLYSRRRTPAIAASQDIPLLQTDPEAVASGYSTGPTTTIVLASATPLYQPAYGGGIVMPPSSDCGCNNTSDAAIIASYNAADQKLENNLYAAAQSVLKAVASGTLTAQQYNAYQASVSGETA